ncbi:hypothetical protein SteCoe_9369 [Stentor coeruleus]|uniref:Ion transport domain-containing protein n=1 Tax=Stentor coeruleus TaxID=5963 RepID=A0A1R2CI43_9CILI|nr:hypothetical protein SteCoe_9369 [Stentor coeruleus]
MAEDLYLKNLAGSIIEKEGLLSGEAAEKLKLLRKSTIASKFLQAIKQNNSEQAEQMLTLKDINKKNPVLKSSGEAIEYALMNNNDQLALSLQKQGFTVPARFLIEAIEKKNEILIKGLIKFNFYSEQYICAYFWYLISEGYIESAQDLSSVHEELSRFSSALANQTKNILFDPSLAQTALKLAFDIECDDLAEKIILNNPSLLNALYIDLALEKQCIGFLHLLATGKSKKAHKSVLGNFSVALSSFLHMEDIAITGKLAIKNLIIYYVREEKYNSVREIAIWPESKAEKTILLILIENKLESISKEYVQTHHHQANGREFFTSFEKHLYSLCVFMIKIGVVHVTLNDKIFQSKLVEIIKSPEKCLYAIEMISMIGNRNWQESLIRDLCINLQNMAKKSLDLIYCPKPILFCVLTAETLERLSNKSYQYRAKCLSVSELYLQLANYIQLQIKGEEDLKHFLLHADSNDRTALSIIAKNEYNIMLENEDVGTIVEKMWGGAANARGLSEASTIYTSFYSEFYSPEAISFRSRVNMNKNYLFQYFQWLDSCSLRFLGHGISTGILLFIYQILVYRTFNLNEVFALGDIEESSGYLRLVQAWIFGIAAEQILHSVFVATSKRYELINAWRLLDSGIIVMMLLISRDFTGGFVQKHFSDTDKDNFVAGVLLSILMVMLWLKFASIMVVSKAFGPFLRIVYFMIEETLNFFIILGALFLCAAGVFTAVFRISGSNFPTFEISLRTVFADAMGGFDITAYQEDVALGASFEAFYLMISNVVLLNLLIAIISNVYETLVVKVDSQHRNIMISYTEKYTWDKKYGFLIFIPSPISFFLLLVSPFIIFSKNPERWNNTICKFLFLIYAIPLFFGFVIINIIYFIPLYVKGFLIYSVIHTTSAPAKSQNETIFYKSRIKKSKIALNKFLKAIFWLWAGIPLILWAMLRDCFDFWVLLYKDSINEVVSDDSSDKYGTIVDLQFIKALQKTLKRITKKDVTLNEFLEIFYIYDAIMVAGNIKHNIDNYDERKEEIEDFFKQFVVLKNDLSLNIEHIKRLMPRLEGGNYDEDYIQRVRFLNHLYIVKGIKKFHSNIGALNISGILIPKPDNVDEFDMERVNVLNTNIKELEDVFAGLVRYSMRIMKKFIPNH